MFDRLLDTEELQMELLLIIDSNSDVLNRKLQEFPASMVGRMAHLNSRLESTTNALPNFHHLDGILSHLLERTAHKSAYTFCTMAGLCGKCLKLAHQGTMKWHAAFADTVKFTIAII